MAFSGTAHIVHAESTTVVNDIVRSGGMQWFTVEMGAHSLGARPAPDSGHQAAERRFIEA
jgi:hypothetical protein